MKLFYGQIFPKLEINEDEQQHILKVLRIKEGEELYLTDGNGNFAKGTLHIEGKKALIKAHEIKENLPNFLPHLHIAIAPTKNIHRTEFFVEKAIEIGISEITFLQTDNSERKNINFERFIKQSIAASKQSLRFHFPKLNRITKLSNFIKNTTSEHIFVAHCHENLKRISLKEINIPSNSDNPIIFLIGPEGDFSTKEIQLLAEKGVKAISLGNQRLRTETAGILIAAWNLLQNA